MDDAEFLRQWETQRLPLELWNHRAHLKVSCLLLLQHGFEGALAALQQGIPAYNEVNGVENTLTSGYHETVTEAWLRPIDTTLRQYGPAETADEFFDTQPQLSSKLLLRLYYSRERLMTAEAKAFFVEPDLAPFPVARE